MNLTIRDASLNYSDVLFEHISFSITETDRVALVGDNGTGKSTLLKCIAKLEELTSGSITHSKGLRIGYVEQDIPESLESLTLYQVVEDAIPADERDWSGYKVELLLESFGADDELSKTIISQLSGGWRRIALIGRAMMDDPEILLLDEPTNHLDLKKILKLENWLNKEIFVPYILISHDRSFLDNCTNKTFFLRNKEINEFSYPYTKSSFLLSEIDKEKLKKRSEEEKEAARLSKTAHDLKTKGVDNYSDSLKSKAKQIKKRAEDLKSNFTEVYIPAERNILLSSNQTHAKLLFSYLQAEIFTPDDRLLFKVSKFEVNQGDRIVILGSNGSGKSQFLKRIVKDFNLSNEGESPRNSFFTPSIKLSEVDQNLSRLPLDKSIDVFFQTSFNLEPNAITSKLVQAGFPYRMQTQKINSLSYGERARIAFLALHLEEPNLYILDEPTNHLDLDGQDRLEAEILNSHSTCILVSHDRRMMNNLGTKYYQIKDQSLIQVDTPESFYSELLG